MTVFGARTCECAEDGHGEEGVVSGITRSLPLSAAEKLDMSLLLPSTPCLLRFIYVVYPPAPLLTSYAADLYAVVLSR